MIFRKSLNKKKGAAYSFFSGLSAAFVPAMLMALLQTLMMAVMPLINFIEIDFGNISHNSGAELSKDAFKFFTYGIDETATLYIILGALGILSILVSVRLFSFICDKKTVNVFYSLGIKRSSLFISKYFAGAVLLIAANIIPVILSYIVNLIFIGPSWQLSIVLLHLYCGLSVFSLICYSVSAVVFSSVGTVSEAVVYSVALLFAPTVIIFITEQIIGAFLPTSTYNVYIEYFTDTRHNYNPGSSLLEATAQFNPLLFFAEELRTFSRGDIENGNIVLIGSSANSLWHIPNLFIHFPWFVFAIALGILGALLFRRIKAENCGFLNTNKVLSNLTIFELCLFGSSILLSEIRWEEISVIIGVGIFAAFVLYLIAEAFLKRNFIKILKSLYKFVIHMTVIAMLFGICATGGFGYSTYIPSSEKVSSVEIAVPFSYSQITTKSTNFGWNSDGIIRVFEAYRFTFLPEMTDRADIDTVMSLNRTINEDDKDDGTNCEIVIRYNYENGKWSERKHTLTNKNEVELLFSLFETKAYKDEIKKLFYESGGVEEIKKQADRYGYVDDATILRLAFDYDYSVVTARADSLYENRVLDLTKEQFTTLKDAVYKDLSVQTAREYFTGSYKQLGVLSFGVNDEAHQIEGINGFSFKNLITYTEEVTSPMLPESSVPGFADPPSDEITEDSEIPEEEYIAEEDSPYLSTDSTPYIALGGMDYASCYDVIITENMTNTLSALNNMGLQDCFTSELTVESVSFREYDTARIFNYYSVDSGFVHDFFAYPITTEDWYYQEPSDTIEDTAAENKTTDKDKIAELTSRMKLHFYTFNSGYFCIVKYTDGSYTMKYLSEADAPDYVKNYSYKTGELMY